MKNKGIIITLIVTLSILCIILAAFLVVVLKDDINTIGIFSISNSNSDSITLDETYELENINEIEISATAGDISFEENENQNIRIVSKGNNSVTANLEGNKLKIECEEPKINFIGINDSSNSMIIYIPKDYSNTISITNDYGNCEAIDLENATLNVDSSYGNVEIGKIKNAVIKCDYGNIEIEKISNKCTIEADCGNIEINSVDLKENSSITSDYGNIEIKEKNDIYVDAKVDLGQIKIDNNNRHAEIILDIDADCGDIKVGE